MARAARTRVAPAVPDPEPATAPDGGPLVRIHGRDLWTPDVNLVDLRTLQEHPKNPNEGDFGSTWTSLRAHGLYGCLEVQTSTRRLLAGHTRRRVWAKLSEEGYVVPADAYLVPVQWLDVDDDEAVRILLDDNHTARQGSDDPALLAELLTDLRASARGLSGVTYAAEDLDELLRLVGGVGAQPVSPFQPPALDTPEPAYKAKGDVVRVSVTDPGQLAVVRDALVALFNARPELTASVA